MSLKELGYVVLAAQDLPAWQTFATQQLGVMAVESPEGALRLRVDERDCRVLIQPAQHDRLLAMGWIVRDEESFEAMLHHVQSRGQNPVMGSSQECSTRRVTNFFAVQDPAGHRHEVAWGPLVNMRQPFVSPAGVTAFHTGEQGMGHIVVGCEPDQYDTTRRFLRDVLGLKLANFRQQSLDAEPVKMPISWFHCDNPRQHSLGLAACFAPGQERHGCRHINLEVTSIDDVGMAYDRMIRSGTPLARTLGRHVNDRAISFYVTSPSGFLIEYGCDAPARDWNQEIVYDEGGGGSIWGHHWISPN